MATDDAAASVILWETEDEPSDAEWVASCSRKARETSAITPGNPWSTLRRMQAEKLGEEDLQCVSERPE